MTKCKNYGCNQPTNENYICCSSFCGWEFKGDSGQLRKVMLGELEWNDTPWGIKNWSVDKYLYYLQVI